ncbi:helix-turn-helix domain-containing protein [Nonomuraea sp. B1E8]|uniref:IclR family transcriptional regulator n=1 Tax=unclassified Nonomuraea TaxID=2593643 RepID=UPI00325DA6C6
MRDEEQANLVTGVGVIDRAVAILDTVERAPMSATELARHLGLSVPTAQRLAASMVKHGLLRRDPQGRYHVGRRFTSSGLITVSGPVLDDLRARTGETAAIWVRRGDHRLCVASAESEAELRASLPVGSRLPLAGRGSAARILEAGDPPDPAHPERRWLESVSERMLGLSSVSAPVRVNDEVVAALCLSAPLSRVSREGPGHQYGDLVVAAAERIEKLIVSG